MRLVWSLLLLASPLLSQADECPAIIWQDEFDGDVLDEDSWSWQEGDGCQLGDDLCGWGNLEWEIYKKENTAVSGGKVIISATHTDGIYASSRIRTRDKVTIDLTKPTRVEASIKVAGGQGIWPAFWMMPADQSDLWWPRGGEIDIMENIGREPYNVHGTFHYGLAWNDRGKRGGPVWTPDLPPNTYHEFAIEKYPNLIKFYLDGYLYQQYTPDDLEGKFTWPLERPYYLLLNVAIGGNWPGNPDATTVFPTSMEVDYIRVYDLKDGDFGGLEGKRLVRAGDTGVEYCLQSDTIGYSSLSWTVPTDATIEEQTDNCIFIDFGATSGYVQVTAESDCGTRVFKIPVKVDVFYVKDLTLVGPSDDQDAVYVSSTGTYEEVEYEGRPAIKYVRNIEEDPPFDNIVYTLEANLSLGRYVRDTKRFYMDVYPTTSAPCTEVILQLEDSTTADPGNYPTGRHSRYHAFIENNGDGWERIEFSYMDQPDSSTTNVDRMVLLFDPELFRGDTYYFANLDSSEGLEDPGDADYEELSTSICRIKGRSEQGACNDGINNDRYGYEGDGTTDECDDADCWDDEKCNKPSVDNTKCRDNAGCFALGLQGLCCPTLDLVYLDCCKEEYKPPPSDVNSRCRRHPKCRDLDLAGKCCPTLDGVMLACCEV